MTICSATAESAASESCHVLFHQVYVYAKETPDSEEAALRMASVIAWFSIAARDQVRYQGVAWVARRVVEPGS